jgi:hypothetical protein
MGLASFVMQINYGSDNAIIVFYMAIKRNLQLYKNPFMVQLFGIIIISIKDYMQCTFELSITAFY